MSLRKMVTEYILAHGECTLTQLIGALSHKIPANHAAQTGKREIAFQRARNPNPKKAYSLEEITTKGRKYLITAAAGHLYREGKIRRVKKGTYAPPLPKVFAPQQSA